MAYDPKLAALFAQLLPQDAPIIQSQRQEIILPTYDDEFDIVKLMREAKDPDTGLLRDLKIDDRDLKQASSFYDYSLNTLKGDAHPPWIMQMWIGLLMFGEVCPPCSDSRWFDIQWMLDHVDKAKPSEEIAEGFQVLQHGVCPKCKRNKHELISEHGLHNYTELVAVNGQRSGKSSSAANYVSYHTHRMLKFPRLAELTNAMQKSTELTTTFVSLTFDKAESLLWTPYRNIVDESSWFGEYHKLLDFYGNKYGVELYRKKDLFHKYFHKGLKLYPSGPKSQTLRGDCLTGDTMINTSRGFVSFAELNFADGFTPTHDVVDTPAGRREFSHTYRKSAREVVGIKTRNGFQLKGTPEHPVLVLRPDLSYRWVRLDALKVGDFIVSKTKKNTPLFGASPVTLDMATIMGSFTANGYRNGISSADPLVIKSFYAAVKRATGNYPSERKTADASVRPPSHDVLRPVGDSRPFIDVLASWGYANVKSAKKEIPLSIRTAPAAILHEYLEAYFACDSGINGGVTSGHAASLGLSTGVEIELSSASKKLIGQLQTILLQVYGIVGRVGKSVEIKSMRKHVYEEKTYTTWILSLTGYDSHLFKQAFRRAKVQRYADRIKEIPRGYGSDRRVIPHVRAAFSSLLEKLRVDKNHYYDTPDGTRVRKPRRPKMLNRFGKNTSGMAALTPEFLVYDEDHAELLKFADHVDAPLAKRLRSFLAAEAHYEEVVLIKKFEKQVPVYDITVPNGHCFTANGLSSHNTRLVAVIDELGLFPLPTGNDEEDEKSDRANADEAHKSLTNSLTTVQAVQLDLLARGMNCPPALMIGVSSPISMRDKVMRRLADSRTPEGKKFILGVNLPTWSVNPYIHRNTPIIAMAYQSNAEKAERDFGANPPRVSQTFIKATQIPYEAFTVKNSHSLRYQYDQAGFLYAKVDRAYSPKYPSVVCIDAGFADNSFTLIGAHFDFATQKTVVTTCLEIMTHDNRKIDFNLVYLNVILPVLKDLHAVVLLADQWQSLDILSRAKQDMGLAPISGKEKPRCLSKQYSPRRKDFDSLVSMIENKGMSLPWMARADYDRVISDYIDYRSLNGEPVKHLFLQMLTVKDMGEGKCPEKGEGFTDDIFRALVLATMIHHDKILERLTEAQAWMVERGSLAMPMPAFRPRLT